VFYQFREAVTGMGEACVALGTPVTGGNVSFYNESPGRAVYPTPTIGMVGLIDDVARVTRAGFAAPGDSVVLLGDCRDELGGTEYLSWIHDIVAGYPPVCDLAAERRLIDVLLEAIGSGVVASAHDCSEGGLAVALAECCIMDPDAIYGVSVDLSDWPGIPRRALLFGESQGRVVVSTSDAAALMAIAGRGGVPAHLLGTVGERGGLFALRIGSREWRAPVTRLADAYHGAIPELMSRVATATDESESLATASG
jgi:phosphoribosylformylglycinamidine synthase